MKTAHTPALGAILLCVSFASAPERFRYANIQKAGLALKLQHELVNADVWQFNYIQWTLRLVFLPIWQVDWRVWGYYGFGGPSSKPEALGPIAYSAYSYYMYILHYKCLYRVNAVLMNIVSSKYPGGGGGETQLPQIIKQHNCFQNGLYNKSATLEWFWRIMWHWRLG